MRHYLKGLVILVVLAAAIIIVLPCIGTTRRPHRSPRSVSDIAYSIEAFISKHGNAPKDLREITPIVEENYHLKCDIMQSTESEYRISCLRGEKKEEFVVFLRCSNTKERIQILC